VGLVPPPPGVARSAHREGQAWACPLFLAQGAAEVSGVKGSPQGCRAQRDAEHPWGRRGGPVACAARRVMSGGEAASCWVSREPAADTWPKRSAPLKDAAKAHRIVETGHSGGKVILIP